ncbi:MAG TPA: hypothetical protein VIW70_07010 [Rubrivivax sp.]
MGTMDEKVEVSIEELKDSSPAAAGDGVVLHTDAVVNGKRRDTSIEVNDADTPALVVALLNGETPAGSAPDLPEAVRCLAIGVVHSASDGHVRLHLQFESGQVVPIEMSHAAAEALYRSLAEHAGSAPR